MGSGDAMAPERFREGPGQGCRRRFGKPADGLDFHVDGQFRKGIGKVLRPVGKGLRQLPATCRKKENEKKEK